MYALLQYGKRVCKAHVVGVGGAEGDFSQNIAVFIGKRKRSFGSAAINTEIIFYFAHSPSL
jgi:hypothetical protein